MRSAETCSVSGTLAGVQQALEAFERFSRARGLSADAVWPVMVALDEMLSNVVRHGGGPRDAGIEVSFAGDREAVEIEIVDAGTPFNPLAAAAPDVGGPLEARRPGGLGIALVRELMDEVRYEWRDNRNHVTLTWRPRPGEAGSPLPPGTTNADR